MLEFFSSLPLILDQGLIYGILGIGVFITFKILNFADLTVDGSFATGGCIFAILLAAKVPVPVCFILAFIAGAVAGLITATLHCYLGIPGILAGILTQLMLWSINLTILGQYSRSTHSRDALISNNVESGVYTTIPIIIGILVLIIGLLYWFFGTKFGSSVRATGSNEAMSKANGININSRKIVALMISNGLVALAGGIYARFQGTATIDMGVGAIVIGLAAIIIGTTLFNKLNKNFALSLVFVTLGSFIYFFVYNLVVHFTSNAALMQLISALIVVAFLSVPYVKDVYIKNARSKHRRAKGAK